MAIKTRTENGKTYFEVYVKARAKGDRSLQAQRRSTGVLEGLDSEELRKKLQRIEIRLYGDAREEVAKLEGAGMTWEKLVERWKLEALDEGEGAEGALGSRTTNAYLQVINDHTDGWFKRPASTITAADFELLVKGLRKTGYASGTIYNVKTAVSNCYKWGIKRRLIPNVTVSPTFGCSISRKTSKRPEILNHTQICTLLEEAERRQHVWYSVWKCILHTGMRSGEAYALKVKDLDREEKRIFLERKYNFETRVEEHLKDHEWRQVPINDELLAFFTGIGVWDMGPEAYVLPRMNAWKHGEAARHLRAFCTLVGLPSICLHTLRACWATQLLRNGVALVKVMEMGGWADLETMQIYLRRAGVETQGATDSLKFEKVRHERPGRVLKLAKKEVENEVREARSDEFREIQT